MPGLIERIDRDQPTLFPERLEDWIGEDHLFVDELDLAGRLAPVHETIADFRRDKSAAIAGTCAQFVELCRRLGTLKGAWVAIDGSKFMAAGSRDRNFTKRMIANRLAHLETDVQRLHRRDGTDRPAGVATRKWPISPGATGASGRKSRG